MSIGSNFSFVVSTPSSCYITLEFKDANNGLLKNLSSQSFSEPTTFTVTPPAGAKSVTVYVGSLAPKIWSLPLPNEKSIEIKRLANGNHTLYEHNFLRGAFNKIAMDASR